ncbi:MAG: hypothetical protein N2316_05025 [Spirochaetes bacterium]|nr:hypothetical protein [Spirochaetota bacterium]
MREERLTFTLTGNFQYDLGILGLKKVLDFFGFEYKSDDYSITINKSDWSNIGKCAYFYGYYLNGLEQIKKKYKIKNTNLTEDDFKNNIASTKCKDFENSINELSGFFSINDSKKIEFASYPALSVFNVSHLNVFNPGYLKQAKRDNKNDCFYNLYIDKFKDSTPSKTLSIKTCDFCQKYEGEPLNRNNFLFASSAMNQGWFEKQNIHICSYCSALNLFATFGTIVTNSGERFLIYSSNLKDLENDNKVLANTFEELISKYIEEIIKVETNAKNKLFIKMDFNSQNPDVDFLPFSSEIIKFFIEKKDLINKLKQNDFIGIAKNPIVYGYKDTIKSIINGEDLSFKADFIVNCIIKQKSGNKNFKGFDDKAVEEALTILKISIILKGGNMPNYLDEFIKFGDDVRKRLYVGKSMNAAKNKAISFASSIRDAVNESKEKFMEIILQLSIYSQLSVPSSLINKINDSNFNYKEAGLAIALALMSKKEE